MPKTIDPESYERKDHFNYFVSLPNPFAGITAEVDVTELVKICKERGYSFYTAFIHCVALAADEIPEFRRRIHGNAIVEYEQCPTSHIELCPNGIYSYCTLHHYMPLDEYFSTAGKLREAAKNGGIEEGEEAEKMYFITCLPWIHYTALVQPTGGDSNPRISWGKYEENHKGRLMMPVSVLVHHALVDGIQIADFYRRLEEKIKEIFG